MNYRYRLYPDITQRQLLTEWMETCRIAFNYGLREIKDWLGSRKCEVDRCSLVHEYIMPANLRFPGEVEQLNALPNAKKVFPRLSEVPSQVLQQAIKQLHRSWEGFQKQGHGFPRFKKYGQFKSLLFPQFKKSPLTGSGVTYGGKPFLRSFAGSKATPQTSRSCSTPLTVVRANIELPKLGLIPINLHRPIPDGFVVKQVRIVRKADRWYASINVQCDVRVPDVIPRGHPIGVDIGLEKFLATSDGVLVKPPKFFKSLQSRLKVLQRRLSRKQKRSKNYEKQRIKVANLHHTIDNTRKDFHYKQAHLLAQDADMIFFEDLDYRVSAKGFLGKHMLDAGFGAFRSIVKYVCWKRDKFFSEVNAWGTSQECPECGGSVKKDLSVRVHFCPSCRYTTDRDVASGQVIRNRGIELVSTRGQRGIESVCAVDLPGVEVTQSRQVAKSRRGTTRKNKK